MAKASKSGAAPSQKAAPDSGAQAGFFIDPSVLAALLGGSTDTDSDNFSLLVAQRSDDGSAPELASISVDSETLSDLLAGASLNFVDGAGNSDGLGCDHGSLMVIDGSNGMPFLPLFFDGAMPVTVPIDQSIVERVECLMPELLENLSGVFATTDEPDSLLLLIVPPARDLPPPPPEVSFG
ncbi:MAG TPA: hypothetical protein VGC46_04770 [Allosphingosinicella sp.]